MRCGGSCRWGPEQSTNGPSQLETFLFLPLIICFSQPPKSPPIPADCWILALCSRLALTRSALTNRHRTAGTATATAGKVEGTGGERGSDFSVALGREQGAGAGQKK